MHTERNPTSAEALALLERIAVEVDAASIVSEVRALAERIEQGRFYVACIGQFKRGKSTVINALLGRRVLPTGVVPVTSVPTIVRYGRELRARVRLHGTGSYMWRDIDPRQLDEFVSEELNPENEKGVLAVELFTPSSLLEGGMCLVDTPGLGSVFAGNSAAVREFIPHIDVAVVVLGADPPITGEELSLVESVAREIEHVMFLLNKADRVSIADCEQAQKFTSRVLASRLGGRASRIAGGGIFVVSALEQLDGVGPPRDWDAVVATLRDLAQRFGRPIVRDAARRGAVHLRAGLLAIVEEDIAALTRPLEESAARLTHLTERIAAAEQALADLGPLFGAEQSRLARDFAERRNAFLTHAGAAAAALLSARLRDEAAPKRVARSRAFAIAQAIAREMVEPWLRDSERDAERAYRDAAARFVTVANDFLSNVRAGGLSYPALLESLPDELRVEEQLRGKSTFYFHEFQNLAMPAGLEWLGQRFMNGLRPTRLKVKQTENAAQVFLTRLLETNTSRVESDLKERILQSRRALESEIRRALDDARQVATGALDRARVSRLAGAESVASCLAQRRQIRAQLLKLLEE